MTKYRRTVNKFDERIRRVRICVLKFFGSQDNFVTEFSREPFDYVYSCFADKLANCSHYRHVYKIETSLNKKNTISFDIFRESSVCAGKKVRFYR